MRDQPSIHATLLTTFRGEFQNLKQWFVNSVYSGRGTSSMCSLTLVLLSGLQTHGTSSPLFTNGSLASSFGCAKQPAV